MDRYRRGLFCGIAAISALGALVALTPAARAIGIANAVRIKKFGDVIRRILGFKRLLTAALAGLACLGGLGSQALAVGIAAPVGSTSWGQNVAVYVVAADGTLRSRRWTGSWSWVNHGLTTSGASISYGVGVSNYTNNSFAHVKGSDGNLWAIGLSGWGNVGTPSGVAISAPIGATLHRGAGCIKWELLEIDGFHCLQYASVIEPVSYIVGSDGNLWSWGPLAPACGSACATFQWGNHGLPSLGINIVKSIGVLTVYRPLGGSDSDYEWNPYIYIIGSDGNVWSRWWSGSNWQWTNHGSPVGGVADGIGVTVISGGTRPFVFTKGNDGNLWSLSWTNSTWTWYNHGKPGGLSISAAIGATCANNCSAPFAFVKAADANLWTMSWQGSYWAWTNHGTPGGVGIGSGVGAVAVDNSRPYAYFIGSDGNLWLRWWSGSAWGWYNNGQP